VIVSLAVVYGLVCLLVFVFQRRLLYFSTVLSAKVAEQVAAKEGFTPWRNNAGEIIGWKLPSKIPANGSVLIVHGNAGSAFDRGYLAHPIRDAGSHDVYVLEYPGYGARPGAPSMASFLTGADEAFAALSHSGPIYVVSESVGTGVAAHLARLHPDQVAGLAMFAPYDNLASVAQSQMPFIPAYLLLRDRFNPSVWLKDYRGPVKVIVAENDEIIPAKSGRRLFDQYQGPKELQMIPGAHHNDVTSQSVDWWKGVFAFWTQRADRRLGK